MKNKFVFVLIFVSIQCNQFKFEDHLTKDENLSEEARLISQCITKKQTDSSICMPIVQIYCERIKAKIELCKTLKIDLNELNDEDKKMLQFCY